jgi:hypothetical protein
VSKIEHIAVPVPAGFQQTGHMRALIGRSMNKIVAELRFVGVRMIISNQVTNQSTGQPPSMKSKLGHRVQGHEPEQVGTDADLQR